MSIPGFDDSRIKDYPDEKLLKYIKAYYKPFINGDADAQKALQTEDFVITDIRTNLHTFPLSSDINSLTHHPSLFSSRLCQGPALAVARHQRFILQPA